MRSFLAFMKKELTYQIRSGRLLFLGIIFCLFGIMNPALAKLTPFLLRMMQDSLAESGIAVTEVTVSALDSWVQFFKNIPMALIVFVLLQGAIFTREYQSGTLVLSVTKGLERYKVVASKSAVLVLLWTAGFWLCFGITYAYNAYFWDNSVAQNLMLSMVCYWLFGIWIASLVTAFSVMASSNTAVLIGTGALAFGSYLIGLFPKAAKYLPTALANGNSLIYGASELSDYTVAIIITAIFSATLFIASVPIFNKKQL